MPKIGFKHGTSKPLSPAHNQYSTGILMLCGLYIILYIIGFLNQCNVMYTPIQSKIMMSLAKTYKDTCKSMYLDSDCKT